ncbi:MAG: hypothetical protein ACRC1D_03970, partial [Culicoidibacterales bacterium]
SQSSKVTNQTVDFIGAKTVKIYSVSSAELKDYDRENGFGKPSQVDATTEEMVMTQDKSFSIIVDKLDSEETGGALSPAQILKVQLQERVVPVVDKHRYKVMVEKAGTKTAALALTKANIYEAIVNATVALDEANVPESGRKLIATPATIALMKQSAEIILDTDMSDAQRKNGVIAVIDGLEIVKVNASALPVGTGFIVAHPDATVAPIKLADYRINTTPDNYSGVKIDGRVSFDAFVLGNKAMAIYVHTIGGATRAK